MVLEKLHLRFLTKPLSGFHFKEVSAAERVLMRSSPFVPIRLESLSKKPGIIGTDDRGRDERARIRGPLR